LAMPLAMAAGVLLLLPAVSWMVETRRVLMGGPQRKMATLTKLPSPKLPL
jgi:hypothetical protein